MLNKYELGMPVFFGDTVGRITGKVEGCLEFNGLPAQVHYTTPHGTTIKTGIALLNHIISETAIDKLKEYESMAFKDIEDGKDVKYYGGKLDISYKI